MNKILAITLNTLKHAIRLKLSALIILFLVLVVIGLPFALQFDGTQKGRIQIILVYSISLAGFLLAVLTIFLSTVTMSKDISSHQIIPIDVKPVKRYEILLGKWLGVMFLNVILIIFMGLGIYAVVNIIGKIPLIEGDVPALQAAEAKDILISRKRFKPQPVDIDQMVERIMEQKRRHSEIPPGITEEKFRQDLRRDVEISLKAVPAYHERQWVFKGMGQPLEDIVVRYRFYAGRPVIQDGLEQELLGVWTAGKMEEGRFIEVPVSSTPGDFHQIYIPSRLLDNGTLYLSYANVDPSGVMVLFPIQDGVEVLVPVGGFGLNLLRGLLLLLVGVAFICTVGIIVGGLFSLPTALAICIFVYGIGLSTGYIRELAEGLLHFQPEQPIIGRGAKIIDKSTRYAFKGLLVIIPDINRTNPSQYLAEAVFISTRDIFKEVFSIIILRVLPLFLVGMYLFYKKEIADVDVSL